MTLDEKLIAAERRIDFALRGGRVIRNGKNILEALNVLKDARDLVEEARHVSEELVARARAEADDVRMAAEAKGHAQAVAQTVDMLASAAHARQVMAEEAEEKLISLSLEIAERLVSDILGDNPARYVEHVRGLLQEHEAKPVELQVNEQQLPLFEALQAEHIHIRATAELDPFEVRILTDAHVVEHGVTSGARALKKVLLDD